MSEDAVTDYENQEKYLKCTYEEMGECEFTQPTYDCANCYLNNICYHCFETCHKDCHDPVLDQISVNSKIICKCGQHRSHQVQQKKIKKEREPCGMMKLDKYLKIKQRYVSTREDSEYPICSMCFYKCQQGYYGSMKNEEHGEMDETVTCKCDHDNHCKNFVLSLNLEYLTYDKDGDNKFDNYLQIINVMFKSGGFNTKEYILSVYENQNYLDDDFIEFCVFFFGFFDSKKYNPKLYIKELRDTFSYEYSLLPLSYYKPQDLKQVYYKMFLIECMYFINIKRDFWKIKSLSFSDFRTNSISVRLNYRKFILSENIFTKELENKYIFSYENTIIEEKLTNLKGFVLTLGSLLSMHMQDMNVANFDLYLYLFKFIKMLLKHMVFSLGELNLLISSLYEYFISLNQFLDKTELSVENLCCGIFAKLLFLIAVSYNDLIVEEKITQKEDLFFKTNNSSSTASNNSEKNKNFIQIENEYTQKLLKMILLNKKFFSQHSKNFTEEAKELIPVTNRIIDESLNIFLNFDNIYLKQFKYFNKNYLESRYHGILYTPNRGEEIKPFLNLKLKIEKNIEDYFYYNIDSVSESDNKEINLNNYFNSSVNLLNEFLENISKIFSNKKFKIRRSKWEQEGERNKSSDILDYKVLKYQKSLSCKLVKTFPQIEFLLNNPDNYLLNYFIQLLIENSLDNCISFFLKTLTNTFENINIFFDFLSIFMLSKSGFISLTTGGNLDRIISLISAIEVLEKEVTEFINRVIKFSKIYQVDMSNHKIIYLIQNQIIRKNYPNNDLIDNLIQKLKILVSLEDILEFDEYEKMKLEMLQLISDNMGKLSFLSDNGFVRYFEEEEKNTEIYIAEIEKNQITNKKEKLGEIDIECDNAGNEKENLLLLNMKKNSSENSNSKRLLIQNEEADENEQENEEVQIHSINYNKIDKDTDKDRDMITASKLQKQSLPNPSNSPPIKTSTLEAKLIYRFFFAFFRLFSNNSFFHYHYHNTVIKETVQDCVVQMLEGFKEYFLKAKSPLFTVNKRLILINTIRTFYFNDKIHSEDINKRIKYLSNDDYVIVKTITDEKYSHFIEKKHDIQQKYDKETKFKNEEFLKIKKIIEIYISEVSNLNDLVSLKKRMNLFNEIKFADYACELLYSIKFFADFILTQNIWNGIYSTLFDLAQELIFKLDTFRDLLSYTTYYSNGEVTNNGGEAKQNNEIILPFPELFQITIDNKENKNSPNIKGPKGANKLKKREIYKTISEIFLQLTKFYKGKNNFSSSLKFLDKFNLLNFSSYSIGDPDRYTNFYQHFKKVNVSSQTNTTWGMAYKFYKSQLSEFENSTFLKLICSKNTENLEFDFEQTLIKFIEGDFLKSDLIPRRELFWKIMLLNNMIFYDTDGAHAKLAYLLEDTSEKEKIYVDNDKDLEFEEQEKNNYDKLENPYRIEDTKNTNLLPVKDDYVYFNFWAKLYRVLSKSLVLNYSYSNRIFDRWFDTEILLLTQELIHFLQLLSEKQNKIFHKIVFHPLFEEKRSFFDLIIDNFIYIIEFLKFDYLEDISLPYDILLVTFDNIVNFLIEYLQSADEEYFKIFEKVMEEKIFKNLSKIIFKRVITVNTLNSSNGDKNSLITNISSQRENVLLFVQSKFIKLLIYFTEQRSNKQSFNISYIGKEYPVNKLYEQIFYNFTSLVDYFINKENIRKDIFFVKKTSFVTSLKNFYLSNRDFRNSLKFNVCLKLYHLNKILVKLYDQQSFKDYLKEIEIDPSRNEGRINYNMNDKQQEQLEDPNFKFFVLYKIYRLLRIIVVRIDIRKDGVDHPVFFTRPFITYSLTTQTKNYFLENVNRDNTYNKLSSLFEKTDFMIFEMICNSKISKKDFFNKILFFKMNYRIFEIINYLFIVAHQILLIYYFYKSTTLTADNYNNFDPKDTTKMPDENLILAIVQIGLCSFVLINWLFNKFPQKFQEILMWNYGKKFVFKNIQSGAEDACPSYTTLKEIYRTRRISDFNILWRLNSKVRKIDAGRVILDSLFFNREINILFMTIIILVIYLITKAPLVLVIPTIFIMNLSTTLYDILLALNLRWRQLLAVLLFTYVCIYLFSWMGLLWLNKLFNYPDPVDPQTGAVTPENYCSSSLQCILYMIDYGMRSGGGIGDVLPKISYKQNSTFFVGKFFYDIVFHISIILILGNIFLGIIVDTFADLRDKNQLKKDDMQFKCFICQMSRDESLRKKIDFENHVNEDHYTWNYVYFLTHLHIMNQMEFTPLQTYVWQCITSNDISWVPIYSDSSEK